MTAQPILFELFIVVGYSLEYLCYFLDIGCLGIASMKLTANIFVPQERLYDVGWGT